MSGIVYLLYFRVVVFSFRGTFIMYTATLGQYEGSLWKSSMQEGLGIVLH